MKKTIQYVRGFTLIELLVVIAIIGILSSVILVSLNSARSKGVNTRIQEDAANLRTAFETDYNGSAYTDLYCASATACVDTYGHMSSNAGALTFDATSTEKGTTYVYSSGCTIATANSCTAYKIEVLWPGAATGGYCVDSTGNTMTYTTGSSTATVTCGSTL